MRINIFTALKTDRNRHLYRDRPVDVLRIAGLRGGGGGRGERETDRQRDRHRQKTDIKRMTDRQTD